MQRFFLVLLLYTVAWKGYAQQLDYHSVATLTSIRPDTAFDNVWVKPLASDSPQLGFFDLGEKRSQVALPCHAHRTSFHFKRAG